MSYVDQVLQQPPKGEWFSAKEHVGHLLAIFGNEGTREEPDNMNPGKTRTVATIDYADLDDGAGGRIRWGVQVDKPGIVLKLKNQRGTILGRLVMGDAKPGQSAPYILQDHTAEEAAYYTGTWLPANRAALSGNGPQRAAAPASAPASAPVPQPSAPSPVPQAQQYVPAPAATAAFPGQVIPAPQAPAVPQASSPWAASTATPAPAPVPAAPAPVGNGSLTNGQAQPYSPETIAAIERMVAAGQLPAFPVPQ